MALDGTTPFPRECIERYDAHRWWAGITLGEMLDRTCVLYPNKEALVAGDVRLTFGDLRTFSDKAAIAFFEQGIRKLDRVLLQVGNSPEFVHAYYGLCKIGAIPVMCRPRFAEREMQAFAELTEASAWIVPLRVESVDYRPMIGALRASLPRLEHVFVVAGDDEPDKVPEGTLCFRRLLERADVRSYPRDHLKSLGPGPDDICHLMSTGGSTGLPKLVPRTHNDFLCNVAYRAKAWERGPRDITLIATPLTHNMALEVSLSTAFLTGGKVVLSASTRAADILDAIQRERVTTMILAVAQAQQIVDDPGLDRYDVSSLQVIATAGSHAPPALIGTIRERLGCHYFNVFGMSEGPCTQTRYGDPDEVILHTVGRPVCPYDEFKVLDVDGNELPPEHEGRLVARGPCIFRGYYKSDADNATAFTADGFFHTGDLAKFDVDGNLIVTGRLKDVIIRGGVNISASAVEDPISAHPSVAQVAAVAMPDPILGERVCAYIAPKPNAGLSFGELIAYLKELRVSVTYWPERMEIVDSLPLTSVRKVDKALLREDIKARLARESGTPAV